MTSPVELLIRDLRVELMRARCDAYRRALRAAGYTTGSVEVMVERDREWLQSGDESSDEA